jgi:hypothetical protein
MAVGEFFHRFARISGSSGGKMRRRHRRGDGELTKKKSLPDAADAKGEAAERDVDSIALCERDSAELDDDLIRKMARTYNTFLCSILRNSMWTLKEGNRSIIAGLDVRLTGLIPECVSEVAEQRMRALMLGWANDHGLLLEAPSGKEERQESEPRLFKLKKNVVMEFSPGGEIAFWKDHPSGPDRMALVLIDGNVDPAAALERYAAATGELRQALAEDRDCETILLSTTDTWELKRRVREDGLVKHHFSILALLERSAARDQFFTRLFRSTLGL